MVIYTYYGNYKNKRDELLKKASEIYMEEKRDVFPGGLYHSISHTGNLWGCLISNSNIGMDLQEKRDIDCNKLASRFFLPEEGEYVRENGPDGFFDIWVRKEACVKYYKTGLMRDIKSFSVVSGGVLTEFIMYKGSFCYVNSFEYSDEVKCAYCCDAKSAVPVIRELR